MNKNSRIYIFSRTRLTFKTQQILEWSKGRKLVGGLLVPNVNGLNMLLDLRQGSIHTFQVNDSYAGERIVINGLNYAKTAFEKAQTILIDAAKQSLDWLIIDEVGRLEIEQGEGLEPAVLRIVSAFQSGLIRGKLLLIIPDNLLKAAIAKYDLLGCRIFSNDFPEV